MPPARRRRWPTTRSTTWREALRRADALMRGAGAASRPLSRSRRWSSARSPPWRCGPRRRRGSGPPTGRRSASRCGRLLVSAAAQRRPRDSGGARAGAPEVRGAQPARHVARRAVRAAGHRGDPRHPRDLRPRRGAECGARCAGPARAADLRTVGRDPGACLLQLAAGGPADPAGLARDPRRAVPARRLARLPGARRGAAPRMADAARGGAGGAARGLPDLHHQLRGGADAGRRAAGDDGRAGDLPGVPVRLRSRARGASGAGAGGIGIAAAVLALGVSVPAAFGVGPRRNGGALGRARTGDARSRRRWPSALRRRSCSPRCWL